MTPAQTVARSYQRIREHNDPAIFISLRDEQEALAEAAQLADPTLPLYGVPVAVKDNIDVAGMPTTAAALKEHRWVIYPPSQRQTQIQIDGERIDMELTATTIGRPSSRISIATCSPTDCAVSGSATMSASMAMAVWATR